MQFHEVFMVLRAVSDWPEYFEVRADWTGIILFYQLKNIFKSTKFNLCSYIYSGGTSSEKYYPRGGIIHHNAIECS